MRTLLVIALLLRPGWVLFLLAWLELLLLLHLFTYLKGLTK